MNTGFIAFQISNNSGSLIKSRAFAFDTTYNNLVYQANILGVENLKSNFSALLCNTHNANNSGLRTHIADYYPSYLPPESGFLYYKPFQVKVSLDENLDSIVITPFFNVNGGIAKNYFNRIYQNKNNQLYGVGYSILNGKVTNYNAILDGVNNRINYESRYNNNLIDSFRFFLQSDVFQSDDLKTIKIFTQTSYDEVFIYNADSSMQVYDSCTVSYPIIENRLRPFPVHETTVPFLETNDLVLDIPVGTITELDALFTNAKVCENITRCDSIKIISYATDLCLSSDTFLFKLHKSASCKRGVNWKIDSSFAQILSKTDSSLFIKFTKAGKGYIHANFKGCNLSDSLLVNVNEPSAPIKLGADTMLCPNKALLVKPLNNGRYKHYLWSNGNTDSSISTSIFGMYYLSATDYCNRISIDTIIIIKPDFKLDVGYDRMICKQDSLILTVDSGFQSYNWTPTNSLSNPLVNSTLAYPVITTTYSITATKYNGCTLSDVVTVNVKDCPDTIFFPTAFTPNNDGLNDCYKPIIDGNLSTYRFIIYNRYGQKIFSSDKPQDCWDGNINGKLQQNDSYIFICKYQFKNKKTKEIKGNLILIR